MIVSEAILTKVKCETISYAANDRIPGICNSDPSDDNARDCDGACLPGLTHDDAPTMAEIQGMCPSELSACQGDHACPGELQSALALPSGRMPGIFGSAPWVALITCIFSVDASAEPCLTEIIVCASSATCHAIIDAPSFDEDACNACHVACDPNGVDPGACHGACDQMDICIHQMDMIACQNDAACSLVMTCSTANDVCGQCHDACPVDATGDQCRTDCDLGPCYHPAPVMTAVAAPIHSEDACGVCLRFDDTRRDTSCRDCLGVAGGLAKYDRCGCDLRPCLTLSPVYYDTFWHPLLTHFPNMAPIRICDNDPSNDHVRDCEGRCAPGVPNAQGITRPDGSTVMTAAGAPLVSVDVCGLCLANSDPNRDTSCQDCLGIPGGSNRLDDCGVCDNARDNDNARDCSGACLPPVTNSADILDAAGNVLTAAGTVVVSVDSPLNSVDSCNVCMPAGDPARDSSCRDCLGAVNGPAKFDKCGICAFLHLSELLVYATFLTDDAACFRRQ